VDLVNEATVFVVKMEELMPSSFGCHNERVVEAWHEVYEARKALLVYGGVSVDA
jgi:hypothetical protein